MTRLYALWDEITDSLWFVPTLLTAVGAGLAFMLIRLDNTLGSSLDPGELWWLFGGSPEGAQGVLQAIATSIITVTGVVFSVTIVALQLASSQFTPRVLRQFTADRANQIVLGVFIGTFTYTLLVQRTLRFEDGSEYVPNFAVTGAVALALTSIGFLIFFINHAARSIQASVIIDAVARDTLATIAQVFPERCAAPDEQRLARAEDIVVGDAAEYRDLRANESGYVQAIDRGKLERLARLHQVLIRTEVEIGAWVLPGRVIFSVWPGADVRRELEDELRGALVLGLERTPHQDLKHGVIELMDIAVKALSPSVNDPTTALAVVDRLGEILLDLAWRRRGDRLERHADGRPLVIVRRPRLDDTVGIAFNQIRHYSASNPTVSIHLIEMLAQLATSAPVGARQALLAQFDAVTGSAMAQVEDATDRLRVENAVAAARERVTPVRSALRSASPGGGTKAS